MTDTGPTAGTAGLARRGARPPSRAAVLDLAAPFAVGLVASVAGLTVGIATGQRNWSVYLVVMMLGAVAIADLHRRVGLSRPTVWGLVVFGIGHVAGGMVPVGDGILYEWWLVDGVVRYDNLQHAVGFGFVGRATWEALRHRLAPAAADLPVVVFWIVVLGAAAFGAANEIIEYVLTLLLAETNVGGYDNTARDLVANLVGGLVAGGVTARAAVRAAARSTTMAPDAATTTARRPRDVPVEADLG